MCKKVEITNEDFVSGSANCYIDEKYVGVADYDSDDDEWSMRNWCELRGVIYPIVMG